MDLFEYARQKNMDQEAPLASRLRPTTLEEVVGQQHIIGKDKLLYRAIKADKLSSIIFYGPPGTGKTTLAKVIAHTTSAEFTQINATVVASSAFTLLDADVAPARIEIVTAPITNAEILLFNIILFFLITHPLIYASVRREKSTSIQNF